MSIPDPEERNVYRQAVLRAEKKLQGQNEEAKRRLEDYELRHSNFYLVEAAREVAPGDVVVIRYFGPERSATTVGSTMNEVLETMRSVRAR